MASTSHSVLALVRVPTRSSECFGWEAHQLSNPDDELWRTGGCRSDIGVVRSNGLAGSLPAKVYLASWVRQGDGTVLANGRVAVLASVSGVEATIGARNGRLVQWVRASSGIFVVQVLGVDASRVRVVEDRQRWEVLPSQTGLVCRAFANIRGK